MPPKLFMPLPAQPGFVFPLSASFAFIAGVTVTTRHFLSIRAGDLDGFFGLFVDNLLQLLLIFTLCPLLCGITAAEVVSRILPGAALSILAGNLFFAWQAMRA